MASHVRHTRLAASICSMAGPVVPTGKKRSGSVCRQAASLRQSSASHSTERFHMSATTTSSGTVQALAVRSLVNPFTWLATRVDRQGRSVNVKLLPSANPRKREETPKGL